MLEGPVALTTASVVALSSNVAALRASLHAELKMQQQTRYRRKETIVQNKLTPRAESELRPGDSLLCLEPKWLRNVMMWVGKDAMRPR